MATNEIKLGINLRQNKNSKNAGYGKYYPEVDTQTTLTLRGFAKHMSDHGCIYGLDLIEGVLKKITQCLPELISQGVPVRLVLGARDLEQGLVEIMRRDTLEKQNVSIEGIEQYIQQLLGDIQQNIYQKAVTFRDAHIYECDNYDEFKERIKDGGFFLCHWDGTAETEAKIKEDTQATIRCVPYAFEQTPGTDMVSGKPATCRVLIARAY